MTQDGPISKSHLRPEVRQKVIKLAVLEYSVHNQENFHFYMVFFLHATKQPEVLLWCRRQKVHCNLLFVPVVCCAGGEVTFKSLASWL